MKMSMGNLKLFILMTMCFLLVSSNQSQCMQQLKVTLPTAAILKERLVALGLTHFLGSTNCHSKLGGQAKYPEEVVVAIECYIGEYVEYLGHDWRPATLVKALEGKIIKALLEDHPSAIEQLIDLGMLD